MYVFLRPFSYHCVLSRSAFYSSCQLVLIPSLRHPSLALVLVEQPCPPPNPTLFNSFHPHPPIRLVKSSQLIPCLTSQRLCLLPPHRSPPRHLQVRLRSALLQRLPCSADHRLCHEERTRPRFRHPHRVGYDLVYLATVDPVVRTKAGGEGCCCWNRCQHGQPWAREWRYRGRAKRGVD